MKRREIFTNSEWRRVEIVKSVLDLNFKNKIPTKPSNYSEYFTRKASHNSKLRRRGLNINNSSEKFKGTASQERFKSKISLNPSILEKRNSDNEIKVEKSFQTPSLKSISISLKSASKWNQPRTKISKFNKYIMGTRKYKNERKLK